MLLLARIAVVLFTLAISLSAKAQGITAYEWVQQSGSNNVIDSNASSCDPTQGCYDVTGALCSAHPGQRHTRAVYPVRGMVRGRASRVCAASRMPAFGAPKPLYPRRCTISKKNRSSKA